MSDFQVEIFLNQKDNIMDSNKVYILCIEILGDETLATIFSVFGGPQKPLWDFSVILG